MKKSFWRGAFFSFCMIGPICLHCSKDASTLTGGGVDIGNPAKVCVVDSLNRPVANASVKIIPSDYWFANIVGGKSAVSDSAFTDMAGFVSFAASADGIYNVQVDHPSGGALATDRSLADSQTVTLIRIKKYGALSGAIRSATGEPVQIRLAGTACFAPINPDGTYLLSNVPQGICIPMIAAKGSLWTSTAQVNVVSGMAATITSDVSFNTLLIDDFEDSATTMNIGRFVHGSKIYASFANNTGTTAQFQIIPEGIKGRNALKASLIRSGAWTLVGFQLGVRPGADSLWDFSAATGLSFYAKGSGKLNVSFESDSIDKMGFFKHYSADVVLPTGWQRIAIPFDSLKFYKDANPDPAISWKESARSIKRIEFNALEGDTVELWLDDLVVDGVDFSTIVGLTH
jgi:hypothetical protein